MNLPTPRTVLNGNMAAVAVPTCLPLSCALILTGFLGGCGIGAGSTNRPTATPADGAVAPGRSIGASGNDRDDADEPFPAATPRAVVAVTHKIFPTVVRIDAAQLSYIDGRQSITRDIGSGVIFDGDGHILTNFHVAGRATEIYITLFNKERVHGRLVGSDHWTDLAVLQMDMDEVRAKNIDLQHADFGDSSILVPGQDVIAIGTPFGLARTMTLGTVSNVERTLYPDNLNIEGYETGGYSNWIQMDVPINPGNSGGPLVDLHGKVVGINTRGGAQNLNFAVPINTAKPVVAAILTTSTDTVQGHFDRSDLGVNFKPMQDLESFYKVDANHGVLINGVNQFSAAQRAGLEPQDVLLEIDGMPTNARFPEELAPMMQMIAALPVDKPVALKIQRGGNVLTLTATTDRLQGAIGEESALKEWGVSVSEVTRTYADLHEMDSPNGMIITSVTPEMPASKAGLLQNDVIETVNGQPITDAASFQRIAKALTQSRAESLFVQARRGRGRRSFILKPDYGDPHTPATQSTSKRADAGP